MQLLIPVALLLVLVLGAVIVGLGTWNHRSRHKYKEIGSEDGSEVHNLNRIGEHSGDPLYDEIVDGANIFDKAKQFPRAANGSPPAPKRIFRAPRTIVTLKDFPEGFTEVDCADCTNLISLEGLIASYQPRY